MIDIRAGRLRAQRLVGDPAPSPVEVVRLLGAVQAQDYAGAKWAVGQRSAATDSEIDALFDEGRILRTHVMRPTWHFVLPDDIRWLQELTGPHVRRSTAGRFRQLGMDDDEVARATEAMCGALAGGRFLTRRELEDVLSVAGISTEGQRLPHLLMAAELDGAIASGPRRAKQFTYALLSERAPGARTLDREEALAELLTRYFRSHGPAQVADFVWWSGLTAREARAGLKSAELERQVFDGKEYWFDPAAPADPVADTVAHLLPNWDEYTVGYRDREAILPFGGAFDPAFFPFGSVLANVVTAAGRVRGAWSRKVTRAGVRLEIRLLEKPDTPQKLAVEETSERLSRFLDTSVEVEYL